MADSPKNGRFCGIGKKNLTLQNHIFYRYIMFSLVFLTNSPNKLARQVGLIVLLLASALHRKSYKIFHLILRCQAMKKRGNFHGRQEGREVFTAKHLCITEKKIKARDLTFIACHMNGLGFPETSFFIKCKNFLDQDRGVS